MNTTHQPGKMPQAQITINANSIVFSGALNVQSSGDLTIQPRTPGITIGLGDGATGMLNLDQTNELSQLADGFSSITIGNATTGAVDINSASFTDPLNILGATIDVADDLSAGTNAVSLSATTIFTAAGVATGTDVTGSTVTFNGDVRPGTAATTAGQITVAGNVTLDSSDTFTVQLNGTTAGTLYDQLSVTGASRTVTLGNATLAATLGYAPGASDVLEIIDTPDDSTTPGQTARSTAWPKAAQLLLFKAEVAATSIPFTISVLRLATAMMWRRPSVTRIRCHQRHDGRGCVLCPLTQQWKYRSPHRRQRGRTTRHAKHRWPTPAA